MSNIKNDLIKSLLFTILLVCYQSLSAQKTYITGQVTNQEQAALGYVSIGIVNTTTGTVSDEKGFFKLYLPTGIADTTQVRYSMIGYRDTSFRIGTLLKSNDTLLIKMTPSVTELPTAVVRPEVDQYRWFGKTKTGTKTRVNFAIAGQPRQNLGAEIGRIIKLKSKKNQLDAVRFYLNRNDFTMVKFRLKFYKVKNGKPGDLLINEDIILTVEDRKKGWVEIPMKAYQIDLPKKFAMALQWIDYSDDGKILSMPMIIPSLGGKHLYKFGSQAKWKRFRNIASCLSVKVGW